MIIVFAIGGILLILCEIFLPGGIIGAMGGLMLIVSITAAFIKDPTLGACLLIGSLIFGLIALWLWVKFFPSSPIGKRVFLAADGKEWEGFDHTKASLAGQRGVARTDLHPGGIAVFDSKRVDVVTRGELVEANTPIDVIMVEGNRVVVAATAAEPDSND
ncbi:MAG: NfeD family protein [Lentisphaeria bacterium]|nr:NfeD family protein [Lentisphaeria bacterium]